MRADLQREALIAAVGAEDVGFAIDTTDAEFLVGWENAVLSTRDGWIVRFPRGEHDQFVRELAILARLTGRLSARIPRVMATGKRRDFAVYRRLDGSGLDLDAYAGAPPEQRTRLATSLARFLAAMHVALDAQQIAELKIPAFGAEDAPMPTDTLSAQQVERFEELRRRQAELLARTSDRVLLHNDFHPGNFVLDRPLGTLAGVWDFSCVAVGDPSLDFRYLVGDSLDLAQRVASAYAARTGHEIDLGLARLTLQIEEVSDALEEGRDPAPYLTSGMQQ